MNQEWKIKKVRETAVMPVRATEGSAGLDLSACLPEPLVIPPGGRALLRRLQKFPGRTVAPRPRETPAGAFFPQSS